MNSSELIVNPYAEITSMLEENGDVSSLVIVLPVRNQSKKAFAISADSHAELIDFILDLTKWGFSHFEAGDLTDEEREFLLENGFLVEKDEAPDKPLFACFIDEVEIGPSDYTPPGSELIVNPSLRYDSFDLSAVSHLIHDNNFSPHFSSVWIKLPVTGIEIGYWLRDRYLEVGREFTAGETPDFEIDEEIAAKFYKAGILINPLHTDEQEKEVKERLELARENYRQNKYVVIDEILPAWYMRQMKTFFRQYVSHGFMPFNDSQVKRRFYQHNLPLAQFFHKNFTKLMSIVVGEEVIPSYVYAASYIEQASLDPHVDREQCEHSISFQVDYLPEPDDDISPWPLYVSPLELAGEIQNGVFPWDDYPEDRPEDRQSRKVNLRSGDGLIYKGRELVHYRYSLPKGHRSTSLFFHYVPKDFQLKLN